MKRWVALFLFVATAGCASNQPAPRMLVTGPDLNKLLAGATIQGRSNDPKDGFIELYYPDGQYEVAFTNDRYQVDYGKTHKGQWRIEDGKVCRGVQSLGPDRCAIIYKRYNQIEYVSPTSGETEFYSYEIRYGPRKSPVATGPQDSGNATSQPDPAKPVIPVPEAQPAPAPQAAAAPANPDRKLKPVGSGSGFIVNNDTYVLTNAHVIKGCQAVTVMFDGQDVRAIVRARDRQNDLALLRLPAGKHAVAAFQGDNRLYPGDSVVAIGYPLSDILASEGTVSVGIVNALAGMGNNASHMQISNPIQPGNSGGPLFDMSGHVVGVIVSRLDFGYALENYGTLPENVNFAIKSSVATSFLQASGVEFQTRNSAEELRPSDVARKGRPATVPVWCWE